MVRFSILFIVLAVIAGQLSAVALYEENTSWASASPKKTPIIIVPGILGSELTDQNGRKLWGDLNTLRSRFVELPLEINPADQVRATQLIQEYQVGPFKSGVYSPLIDFLESQGWRRGVNIFEFPYDWRQSNFESARRLKDYIDDRGLKDKDIYIVAHSMGGLVSLIYLQKHDKGNHLKRLVTVGTPYFGAMKAFQLLADGLPSGFPALIRGDSEAVKKVLPSLPSVYELLPTYDFCCSRSPVQARRSANTLDLLNSTNWTKSKWLPASLVNWDFRTTLKDYLSSSQKLKELVKEPSPAGCEVFRIAGTFTQTIAQVEIDARELRVINWIEDPGDGTVPQVSASAGRNDAYLVDFPHDAPFEDRYVRKYLENFLSEGPIQKSQVSRAPISLKDFNGRRRRLAGFEIQTASDYILTNSTLNVTIKLIDETYQAFSSTEVSLQVLRPDNTRQKIDLAIDSTHLRATCPASALVGVHNIELTFPSGYVAKHSFLVYSQEKGENQ